MKIARAASAALVLAVMAAAVPAEAKTIRVDIKDLVFVPATVMAEVGDVIEWRNADFIDHTATAKDGSFDVMIEAGKSATLTVRTAGSVDYLCAFHPNMTGTIQVPAK
jgi:plastocyanin